MNGRFRFVRTLLLVVIACCFVAAGCGDEVIDTAGSSCDTSDDCADDEICANGVCVGDPDDCEPTSCEDEGVECGTIADGCGGSIFCGGCDAGEMCGTGDDAGQCVDSDCEPTTSCEDEGVECGPIPDGCGGAIDCGSCGDGETCGAGDDAGQCVEEGCDPITCDDVSAECGPIPDGCGGALDCGDCGTGEICGVGEQRGVCLDDGCEPKSCDDYDDVECGYASDGCSGVTEHCGECEAPEICGGGGDANLCGIGTPQDPDCTNLCQDQVPCADGEATTISGTVYAPNETLPVPNAAVYVPNVDLDDLPPIEEGPVCEQCGDEDLGEPLVGTVTDYDGTFELRHVPAATEFPLVIKIGQWRRVVTVPAQQACESNSLPSNLTRLPTEHEEDSEHDNIPKTAVSTGRVDAMECVLHKLGVEDDQFTRHDESGRIHLYRANGGVPDSDLADACDAVGCADDGDPNTYGTCIDRPNHNCGSTSDGLLLQEHMAWNLYESQSTMDLYDMIVMDCEGLNYGFTRSTEEMNRFRDYVDGGGRLFASHFSYEWLAGADDLQDTASWDGPTLATFDDTLAYIDDSGSDGLRFWNWLQLVDADYPDAGPAGEPQIEVEDPRGHVTSIDDSLARKWVYTDADEHALGEDTVQQFSFNAPVNASASDQCGQVVYSAFHVTGVEVDDGPAFPSYCDGGELTPQEKVLAYMLFDLAACVTDDTEPPAPECEPLTCSEAGVDCGEISDGCGGTIDCGGCPDGTTCGAGGEPNICAGDCTPLTCAEHDAECGVVDDGCGGTVDCGGCLDGLECGGAGDPISCSSDDDCNPLTCDDHNAECGEVDDGCGGTDHCGDCFEPEMCGIAGDEPLVCGCEPLTCDDHGVECGDVDDGCGDVIDCGDCSDGVCDANFCVAG